MLTMCGRLILDADSLELTNHFDLDKPPSLAPRYNIAPSQLIAVVAPHPGSDKRGLALLKWGLIPEWSPDGKPGPINARAETIASKPTFAESFRSRRCLIPSTGFYEWAKHGGKKMPQFIRAKGGGLLAFAGLWSFWRAEEGSKPLLTCCIITTKANELVSQFHDRMPAIIQPKDYSRWLDPETPAKDLKALLQPYPAELMEFWPVDPAVNRATVEGPQLLNPIDAA